MSEFEVKRRSRLRLGGMLAALMLAVAAAHLATWWVVTGRIEAGVPPFVAQAGKAGWQIEAGAMERAGWPWAATVRLSGVTATRTLGGTSIRWTSERIMLSVSASDRDALSVIPEGEQAIAASPWAAVPVHTASALVRVPFSGAPATFDIRDMDITSPSGIIIHARRAVGTVAPLSVGFTVDAVTFAPGLQAPFDGPLALTAQVIANRAFPDAASPGASATAWQAAGGRMDIPALELRWGPLHVTGTGSGGLNPLLQPQGQAHIQVEGAAQVLDSAARSGLVAAGPASAARAVIGLLTIATRGGPVSLPVTLMDRTLSVAQFPLLRAPTLEWNEPR